LRSRLPVLRQRKRYLVLEIESEEPVSEKDLSQEILSSQVSLFGDLGTSRNRLRLISFCGRFGILRCSYLSVSQTRAALATIRSIGGIRAAVRIKGTSGTIRAATEKYIPQLSLIGAEKDGRRIELEEVSGCIAHIRGSEIDLIPDDRYKKGSDTRYLGLTSFDLGGCDDADGTADGL
jgi:ribonuclease P/MRP protein subunit POP5